MKLNRVFFMILLLGATAAAGYGEPKRISLKEASEKIADAKRRQIAFGAYKVEATYPTEIGARKEVAYYKQVDPSTQIGRIESTIIGKRTITTSVTLRLPSGTWSLRSGYAIKAVGMSAAAQSALLDENDNAIPKTDGGITCDEEQYTEEGVHYTRITETLDETTREKIKASLLRPEIQALMAKASAAGKPVDASRFVPVIMEYLIDDTHGYIARQRKLSADGVLLSEKKIDAFVELSSVSDDLFSIPTDAKLLFPKTINEYYEMCYAHADVKRMNLSGKQKQN